MKCIHLIAIIIFFLSVQVFGQSSTNCFLEDFQPKNAEIPAFILADKPAASSSVLVTINKDTLGKISKYIFGNAIAVWEGNVFDNAVFVKNTQILAPSLIRYPGGSWSDIFFWNGIPSDIPDSLYDVTGKKDRFYPPSGNNSWPTTLDNYYVLREKTGAQGLITINYAYARYGLSQDPVAQAAHYAADWVRYDNGRTKFWEIGNENGGPWEAGWQIDTATNKDAQPAIISGALYGKHFKVFADSMRKAAIEVGATIYIGGQVLNFDGTDSWNVVDKKWNEGFFKAVGDSADFYLMHNYFGNSIDATSILGIALTEPAKNIDFVRQDIIDKNASPKPVAITEFNINDVSGTDKAKISIVNGLQSVILFGEMIKNNFGLAARWLLTTGETGGMYYNGTNALLKYQPRPDFYYLHYMKRFTGDHALATTSSNHEIAAYSSSFNSGETGIIVVNTGKTSQTVTLTPNKISYGDKYYIYSLTGGADNGDFSQKVSINGTGPKGTQWGPIEAIENIPANAYAIENEIKFTSPGRSVQFIMLDGAQITSVNNKRSNGGYVLQQNFPNPFSQQTVISYSLPQTSKVILKIYDMMGRDIATLVNNERKAAGEYKAVFNAGNVQNGAYFYNLQTEDYSETKRMLLIK